MFFQINYVYKVSTHYLSPCNVKRGATPSIQFKWLIEFPRMGFSDKSKYGFLELCSAVLPSVWLFLLEASVAGNWVRLHSRYGTRHAPKEFSINSWTGSVFNAYILPF